MSRLEQRFAQLKTEGARHWSPSLPLATLATTPRLKSSKACPLQVLT